MSGLGDSLAALGEPEFRKLFVGQATSVVGAWFRVVALLFAVLAIGGTATDIGIVEAAGLIPLAVLVLLGGVAGGLFGAGGAGVDVVRVAGGRG